MEVRVDIRHWTALLRLMSVMVIADGRVLEEELRVFVFRMTELRRRLAPKLIFSEGLVRDWFEAQRAEIADHTPEAREAFLEDTLATLDELDKPKQVVDAINAVARADGFRHESEMEVLERAASRWGVRVPRR